MTCRRGSKDPQQQCRYCLADGAGRGRGWEYMACGVRKEGRTYVQKDVSRWKGSSWVVGIPGGRPPMPEKGIWRDVFLAAKSRRRKGVESIGGKERQPFGDMAGSHRLPLVKKGPTTYLSRYVTKSSLTTWVANQGWSVRRSPGRRRCRIERNEGGFDEVEETCRDTRSRVAEQSGTIYQVLGAVLMNKGYGCDQYRGTRSWMTSSW